MAKKVVEDAVVYVDIAGVTKMGYTNENGETEIDIPLSDQQYNQAQELRVTVNKTGYLQGEAIIRSLPPINIANTTGISAVVDIQKYMDAVFTINPTTLSFSSSGGTQDITVNCPDNTWTPSIEHNSTNSDISVVKVNSTTARVTCPASTTARNAVLEISWYSDSWQYRQCSIYQAAPGVAVNAVTFRGKLIDASTNQGIPNIKVVLRSTYAISPSEFLGEALTDSNGNWSIVINLSESQWPLPPPGMSTLGSYTAEATAIPGYTDTTISISFNNLPPYIDATTRGITFNDLKVSPLTAQTGWVRFYGNILYNNRRVPGVNLILNLGDPLGYVSSAITDGNGYFVMDYQLTKDQWDNITTITLSSVLNQAWVTETLKVVNPSRTFESALLNGLNFGNTHINPNTNYFNVSSTQVSVPASSYGADKGVTITVSGPTNWEVILENAYSNWGYTKTGSNTFVLYPLTPNTNPYDKTSVVVVRWGVQDITIWVTQKSI